MNNVTGSISHFILSLLIVFSVFSAGNCAEIDDSTVFVEAFSAYQKKDYLLTIEKCNQLDQAFPDSPLRDVNLLLIARASLKAGDNERAAKSVVLFASEFPESSLKSSVEDELKLLASRHLKGDLLAVDKTLQAAARKVGSDRLALERAAELKMEMERMQAEKIAKAGTKDVFTLRKDSAAGMELQGESEVIKETCK